MKIDFPDGSLCFYCRIAKIELLEFGDFHSKMECAWAHQSKTLHQHIDSLIANHPEKDSYDIAENYFEKLHNYANRYPEIHRIGLVISIFIFLEHRLNGLCCVIGKSINSKLQLEDINGKGVRRAFLFLSKIADFELDKIKLQQFVTDVNELRNKLVHADGVLPDNSGDQLNRFVENTTGLDGKPGSRVHISADFIHELIKKLGKFFDELDPLVVEFMRAHNI